MKISNNFSLDELLQSQTATRKQIKEQFTPPQEVINNLKDLVVNVLQPIRNLLGCAIRVSSGYRCLRLNKAIGGSTTSQHSKGQAGDIKNTCGSDIEIAKVVVNHNIEFDQMIIEFGTLSHPQWIHISYNKGKNRKQILRAYKSGKKTVYMQITTLQVRNA